MTRIRGEIFIHAAALCEPLGGCCPQPEQPPVTLDYLKGLGPLSMLAPLSRTSESSILPMQTLLPLTLSLTFCNHEILMTNIEFKVQFVSGSRGGKGSCKGIVLREEGGLGEPRMGQRGWSSAGQQGRWLSGHDKELPRSVGSSPQGRPGPSTTSHMRSEEQDNEKGSLCVVLPLEAATSSACLVSLL